MQEVYGKSKGWGGVGWVCDVMRVVKIRVYSISFVYGIRYTVYGIRYMVRSI